MNARAFQVWTGRLALLALLLLVSVPTASRLEHTAGHGHAAVSAPGHGHHGHHGHHGQHAATPRADGRAPLRPAPGDADCDYCPLLSSLLASVALPFSPHIAPRLAAALPWPASPRLPWLHPSGLGSRGPPLHG